VSQVQGDERDGRRADERDCHRAGAVEQGGQHEPHQHRQAGAQPGQGAKTAQPAEQQH
jgi:hypothetical protein